MSKITALEDGTQISIRKQNLGDRGAARYISISDGVAGEK